jgi:hypothetical protein
MFADRDLLLELAVAGFAHNDRAFGNFLRRAGIRRHVEIALGPRCDDMRHVDGIA